MRISTFTQANGTPRTRHSHPDPFDPARRGPVSRPGHRGKVLTRRQRQERDESARLVHVATQQRAHEESRWVAEVAAQGRIHEFAPRHADAALPGWPLPPNRTGAVADSAVRLWAGVLHNHTQSLSLPGTFDGGGSVRHATSAPRPVTDLAAPALTDPVRTPDASVVTAIPPSAGRLSVGETAVLGWLRQGCGGMMEVARRIRGANWTALHTTIASYTLPQCTVTLDREGNEVSRQALAMAGEAGREFRLVHQPLPPGLAPDALWLRPLSDPDTIAGRIESANVTRADEAADEAADARDPSLDRDRRTRSAIFMRSPFEYQAINAVRLNFEKKDRVAMVEGAKQVAAKLDDFLQAPCQTMSQTIAEVSNKTVGTGEWVATALCDFAYSFTPPGAILAGGGQLMSAVATVVHPPNITATDLRHTLDMLSYGTQLKGIVPVRGRPTLWDGSNLHKFEETESGRGLLVDDSPAQPGVARMPGVPVELGEQGWQLAAVPEAYRVVSTDETFASDPDQIVKTSQRHGYLRIDDALYEVHRDPTTTRWRIVPPDEAQGVTIAIEHVADQRRWQTVTLLGAGDPPPLFERYDVRDAVLRGGAEGDVYADAHAEEFNEDLLPPTWRIVRSIS